MRAEAGVMCVEVMVTCAEARVTCAEPCVSCDVVRMTCDEASVSRDFDFATCDESFRRAARMIRAEYGQVFAVVIVCQYRNIRRYRAAPASRSRFHGRLLESDPGDLRTPEWNMDSCIQCTDRITERRAERNSHDDHQANDPVCRRAV